MKLIKTSKARVADGREVPGLLRCRIEYEVKAAQGSLEYMGPKFAPEMWHQVMSFFRWTYQEMQSESQARLYVNLKLGRWGAWAFPQAARTGMNARELPTQETPEQARERFASWGSEPSDDWFYFGTAHHHCASSAFQSQTDERNEWNQDGLHLTVGRMDAKQHEVHARLYLDGNCYEPDLSRFWSVAPDLAARVPSAMLSELARFQMGAPVTVDFPSAWRANMVEVQSERLLPTERTTWDLQRDEAEVPLFLRVDDALEDIHQRCAVRGVEEKQWLAELDALGTDGVGQIIIAACVKHGVTPEDLRTEVAQGEFDY